ncbi:23959_t:CDS:2 [Gigaspora rosea]|nr:23959_t:CDS:2 [Gigaspora rosea]
MICTEITVYISKKEITIAQTQKRFQLSANGPQRACEWSYSGYLEAVEPYINNSTRLSSLKSIWKERFNEHLSEIAKDRSDEEKCIMAATLLIQYDTNVDIQLNTLKVMSTASSYQRNELSKQMEISGDNDKNLKRQNDDYIEKENSKSCKVEDSGVKKQAETINFFSY